ncbi:hypothetical protein DSM107133_01789 [Pseudosulfitobacter sp. DSM 107133]|nr:hypothetical protein DSM107133_01789 [Pseudosulfitobacter sp. DSM 107133]
MSRGAGGALRKDACAAYRCEMADEKPFFLHAGAHRTGTSSFQMCLHDNRDALHGAGYDLAYPGRDGIPTGTLGLRLPAPRHGTGSTQRFADRVAEAVTAHSPDPARPLILSEENIPGRMMHFSQGRFYPACAARLMALKAGLRGRVARVLFVLRPYDQLYVSGFRKRAEDNKVDDFNALRPMFMAMDRGWPEIVAAMRDILQPDRFLVVPYARRGSSVDALQMLVSGVAGLPLVEPQQVVNLSATDAALLALQARYRAGAELTRAQWKAVIADHANDRTDHGFAAFSDAEVAVLTQRYADDLARIDAMAGVTLA